MNATTVLVYNHKQSFTTMGRCIFIVLYNILKFDSNIEWPIYFFLFLTNFNKIFMLLIYVHKVLNCMCNVIVYLLYPYMELVTNLNVAVTIIIFN